MNFKGNWRALGISLNCLCVYLHYVIQELVNAIRLNSFAHLLKADRRRHEKMISEIVYLLNDFGMAFSAIFESESLVLFFFNSRVIHTQLRDRNDIVCTVELRSRFLSNLVDISTGRFVVIIGH